MPRFSSASRRRVKRCTKPRHARHLFLNSGCWTLNNGRRKSRNRRGKNSGHGRINRILKRLRSGKRQENGNWSAIVRKRWSCKGGVLSRRSSKPSPPSGKINTVGAVVLFTPTIRHARYRHGTVLAGKIVTGPNAIRVTGNIRRCRLIIILPKRRCRRDRRCRSQNLGRAGR